MASDVAAPDSRRTAGAISFGNQLRQCRQRRSWSQRELGAATFFSREYVARIERGERRPTADFVKRAEAALGTTGQLQRAFAPVEQAREREARQQARPRSTTRHRGKIATAAGRLRTATAGASTGDQAPSWWTELDGLHRALGDELQPVDVDADITDLEQRCGHLAADAGDGIGWADMASVAALGLADASALLHRPLPNGRTSRLVVVMAQFATLTGDALVMLDQYTRADAWYNLAATIQFGEAGRDLGCRVSSQPRRDLENLPARDAPTPSEEAESTRPAPRTSTSPAQTTSSTARRSAGGRPASLRPPPPRGCPAVPRRCRGRSPPRSRAGPARLIGGCRGRCGGRDRSRPVCHSRDGPPLKTGGTRRTEPDVST